MQTYRMGQTGRRTETTSWTSVRLGLIVCLGGQYYWRGYGFIKWGSYPSPVSEFFHISEWSESTLPALGDIVYFEQGTNYRNRRLMAINVRRIDDIKSISNAYPQKKIVQTQAKWIKKELAKGKMKQRVIYVNTNDFDDSDDQEQQIPIQADTMFPNQDDC